jgi:hypothetical protein
MPRELLCNTIVLVSIVNSHWIFDNRIEWQVCDIKHL